MSSHHRMDSLEARFGHGAPSDDPERLAACRPLLDGGLARLALLDPERYARLVAAGRAPATPPPTTEQVRHMRDGRAEAE